MPPRYYVHVVRSPDGVSRGFPIGAVIFFLSFFLHHHHLHLLLLLLLFILRTQLLHLVHHRVRRSTRSFFISQQLIDDFSLFPSFPCSPFIHSYSHFSLSLSRRFPYRGPPFGCWTSTTPTFPFTIRTWRGCRPGGRAPNCIIHRRSSSTTLTLKTTQQQCRYAPSSSSSCSSNFPCQFHFC